MSKRLEIWNRFYLAVLEPLQRYQVPVIRLDKETPKEAVCVVFERVNTGGVPLTVFDLLTASLASSGYRLREDWKARRERLHVRHALARVGTTEFLQTVSLLASLERRRVARLASTEAERLSAVTAKRSDILSLTREEYERFAEEAERGYMDTARFLNGEGVYAAHEVPYGSQLAPLAATLAVLQGRWEHGLVRGELARWYWCGVFGELYSGTTETRMGRDVPELLGRILDGDPEPSTVAEAQFTQSRLRRLRMRISAAYKGIAALLIQDGAQDFRTGEPINLGTYFDQKYDIHHIFPAKWCRDQRIDPKSFDCVVNKTSISFQTNRSIEGSAPSIYLKKLASNIAVEDLDHALESHSIKPDLLRSDDFNACFRVREATLLSRIAIAMGKPVILDMDTADETVYQALEAGEVEENDSETSL